MGHGEPEEVSGAYFPNNDMVMLLGVVKTVQPCCPKVTSVSAQLICQIIGNLFF